MRALFIILLAAATSMAQAKATAIIRITEFVPTADERFCHQYQQTLEWIEDTEHHIAGLQEAYDEAVANDDQLGMAQYGPALEDNWDILAMYHDQLKDLSREDFAKFKATISKSTRFSSENLITEFGYLELDGLRENKNGEAYIPAGEFTGYIAGAIACDHVEQNEPDLETATLKFLKSLILD